MKISNKTGLLNIINRKIAIYVLLGTLTTILGMGIICHLIKRSEEETDLMHKNFALERAFNTKDADEDWKEALNTQKIYCAFWSDLDNKTIENPDYKKCVSVKTIEMCGNSAVLFPNENYVEEKGYCLLGRDTAVNLFGSAKVNGRTVCVDGQEYHVAGVLQRQKDVVVLSVENGEFHNVGYLYHNDFEKGKNQRILEGICGSRMKEEEISFWADVKK